MTVERRLGPSAAGVRRLAVPTGDGPWAWRSFADREAAYAFFERTAVGDPEPWPLAEPHLAPDGRALPAGTWVVLYHPIIVEGRRNGDGWRRPDRHSAVA